MMIWWMLFNRAHAQQLHAGTAPHMHRTCTTHGPHSHTLCACCAHCAPRPGVPRPRLRGVRLADHPITFMCAQYMIYAKNVNDDGSVSDLLGFGFDKAALLPPPPSGFSSPHARRTQPHSNRAGATPPPPTARTPYPSQSAFAPPGAQLRCDLKDEVQGLPHV